MPTPAPITASVEISAGPDEVWAVVSDVGRMPEFSPELRRLFVIGSKEPRVGMKMVGINRRKYVAWPTTSTVVRLEPGQAVAWKTRESGATWTYELEPTGSGTRVTGRRDLPKFTVGTTLLAPVIGGAEGHDQELADGIRATLERIKATVEASTRAQV